MDQFDRGKIRKCINTLETLKRNRW